MLEPGVEACLANCRSHPFEPHKYATAAEQDAHLEFLLGWVRDYSTRPTVPRQQEIVRAPRPPHFPPEPGVTRVAP